MDRTQWLVGDAIEDGRPVYRNADHLVIGVVAIGYRLPRGGREARQIAARVGVSDRLGDRADRLALLVKRPRLSYAQLIEWFASAAPVSRPLPLGPAS